MEKTIRFVVTVVVFGVLSVGLATGIQVAEDATKAGGVKPFADQMVRQAIERH